MLEILVFFLLD